MNTAIKLSEPINGLTHRDAYSKALLNSDFNGLTKYKMQREHHFNNVQEIIKIKTDIVSLKDDLKEIKQILLSLSNKTCS